MRILFHSTLFCFATWFLKWHCLSKAVSSKLFLVKTETSETLAKTPSWWIVLNFKYFVERKKCLFSFFLFQLFPRIWSEIGRRVQAWILVLLVIRAAAVTGLNNRELLIISWPKSNKLQLISQVERKIFGYKILERDDNLSPVLLL